ncbi:ferritin-like domain-containing protein [Mucilaginibacter xinganensis]|uniref:Dessication-associated protein n=1 Tax=Mucilaginibacter xinganensis TaxID=1234841 RepID=A0A223P003_9SPHI|nr:ferritin-like domain-containing protein [Mucilaginibacter xinganensis]ASU35435.1 dessication-associated protein [Mucilaginibacter xinganensis]
MNLINIIEQLETVDPEIAERMSPRRAAIKNITSFGSKVAIAALPMAFATVFKKAYGAAAPAAVSDVLNFALTLEYLESYFYNQGAAASGLIPNNNSGYVAEIQSDENQHVAFLKSVLGTAAVSMPAFDLTAGGAFPTVLSNYDTFLAVANVFEDTGVRAYKGQAPNLLGNQVVLGAALSIHAVEARHASVIRQIRASRGVDIAPWITGNAGLSNDTGIGAAVDASYAGENNVMQGGVDVTKLPSIYGNSTAYGVAVEAFDEPLSMAAVLAIVKPFFK